MRRRFFTAAVLSALLLATSVHAQVVISYARADADYLARVLVHLRPLERAGAEVWADTRLSPGDVWREEIRRAIERARVAVLLVSADFLASEFIARDELPAILTAAAAGKLRVLSLVIKPSSFTAHLLAAYQAVNDPRRPLIALPEAEREAIYARLAEAVDAALNANPEPRRFPCDTETSCCPSS